MASSEAVAGSERWLFASDVHLAPSAPSRTELFHRFLNEQGARCTRLFLLGDLFDFYVGPGHATEPDYAETIRELATLREGGVAIEFLHGNRDFQVGAELPFDCVHADDFLIERDGLRVYLAHGDLFCTRDLAYARARRILRSPPVRFLGRMAPVPLVKAVARGLRSYSGKAVQAKGERVTDLVYEAVEAAFRAQRADAIIAGHVHRLRDLEGEIDGHPRRFLGLGAWHTKGSYVELAGGELTMHEFG